MSRQESLSDASCGANGMLGFSCNRAKKEVTPLYCQLHEQLQDEDPGKPDFWKAVKDLGGIDNFLKNQGDYLKRIVGCPNADLYNNLWEERVRKYGSAELQRRLGII